MIALFDDHRQSQKSYGVWSNFSLPKFTNRSVFRGFKFHFNFEEN